MLRPYYLYRRLLFVQPTAAGYVDRLTSLKVVEVEYQALNRLCFKRCFYDA